jgi:Fur family zinc uptake transcriptional regulator
MNHPPSANAFKDGRHDHTRCVAEALQDAEARCRAKGLRLTRIRHRVLEIIWRGHEPVKAYDILDELSRNGKKTAPPTVYRALDFLVGAGLVHRVETLNAFVGCPHKEGDHSAQLLICSECGTTAEIDDPRIRSVVAESGERHGFNVRPQTLEIRGLCPDCQKL